MKKKNKFVEKVKFISASLNKDILAVEIVKIFSDESTKQETHKLGKDVVAKLRGASSQKEFAAVVNNEFVKNAGLDAEAKKAGLTKNTQYCPSRNVIALAVGRLQFAEPAYRQRHEAISVMKKLKVAKKKASKKQVVVKR